MRVRFKVTEGLTVAAAVGDPPLLIVSHGEANIMMELNYAERDALIRTLMGVGKAQYAIMHPSERLLQLNYSGDESWGYDDIGSRLTLFPTAAEAQEHIDVRKKKWPESDWPNAQVVEYLPGVKLSSKCSPVGKI